MNQGGAQCSEIRRSSKIVGARGEFERFTN
jgi:hypothetical protein